MYARFPKSGYNDYHQLTEAAIKCPNIIRLLCDTLIIYHTVINGTVIGSNSLSPD